MPDYIIWQRDRGQTEAKTSRPRPKLRGRGQNFVFEATLASRTWHHWLQLTGSFILYKFVTYLLGFSTLRTIRVIRSAKNCELSCVEWWETLGYNTSKFWPRRRLRWRLCAHCAEHGAETMSLKVVNCMYLHAIDIRHVRLSTFSIRHDCIHQDFAASTVLTTGSDRKE